jgi:hypothetical protein
MALLEVPRPTACARLLLEGPSLARPPPVRERTSWIDTGLIAACPDLGPRCVGLVHSHYQDRPAHGARVGRSSIRVAGNKSKRLVFRLGKRRCSRRAARSTHVKRPAALSLRQPRH